MSKSSVYIEMNKIRNKTLYRGCIHKDSNCNGITSKAHSIQENRYLNKLSDNGDVLCIEFGEISFGDSFELDRVGKKKASIFTGFCNYHDSSIFRPIELFDYESNNNVQNFLFAYRAFALGYFERHSTYGFMKEELELRKQQGKAVRAKELENALRYYEIQIEYIEKLKNLMNSYLDNKRYDRITTDVISWGENYGLAATSMFYIDKDRFGKLINHPPYDISPFFLTIIPQENTTHVIMSYLSKSKSRYDFIKEQVVNANIKDQKIIISNMLAQNVENFFISPKRWDSIPYETREMFKDIFQLTLGGEKPTLDYFGSLNLFA